MGVRHMIGDHWTNGPVGLGAASRVTRAGCKSVLVVVPHVVAGTRLADLLPLLEADHRVQVLFTIEGSVHGTEEFTRRLGGHVLPWDQAIRQRFDLVLAASFRGLDRLHGPVLVLPHGVGALKSRLRPRASNALAAHGLSREQLVRDGQVVAAAIALSHQDELDALRASTTGGRWGSHPTNGWWWSARRGRRTRRSVRTSGCTARCSTPVTPWRRSCTRTSGACTAPGRCSPGCRTGCW
jgi:hypothetical protein